ncbi:MAG: CPBP family intramembrane metalloprotease, partial [Mycobacterium sp.]|nr:CPBP family intramembrane metalloprotease [Mycobacterium sp.]
MLAVTFGVSALVAVLQLADALLSGLSGHRVRLNPNQSRYDLINLGLNLVSVSQLVAWGGLALYL